MAPEAAPEASPAPGEGHWSWWKTYVFGGAAVWIGTVVALASQQAPGEDSALVRLALAVRVGGRLAPAAP